MDRLAISKAMQERSDIELMAIATGDTSGYIPVAQEVAAEVLVARGVSLPDDIDELRRQARLAESEEQKGRLMAEARASGASQKRWGISLLIFGIGSLLLPLAGLQFRVFAVFPGALPILGILCAVLGLVLVASAGSPD